MLETDTGYERWTWSKFAEFRGPPLIEMLVTGSPDIILLVSDLCVCFFVSFMDWTLNSSLNSVEFTLASCYSKLGYSGWPEREISLCEWICKRPPFYYVPAERRGGDFCNQLCLMNSYTEKSKSGPFYHELISFPKSPPSPDLVLRENLDQPNDRHTANLESWCFELQVSVSIL